MAGDATFLHFGPVTRFFHGLIKRPVLVVSWDGLPLFLDSTQDERNKNKTDDCNCHQVSSSDVSHRLSAVEPLCVSIFVTSVRPSFLNAAGAAFFLGLGIKFPFSHEYGHDGQSLQPVYSNAIGTEDGSRFDQANKENNREE